MDSGQIQIPLTDERNWLSLPSPKVRKRDVLGVHSWTHAYAGFSFQFAKESLKLLDVDPSHTLLDPFVGSGTSVVAAATMGAKAVGIDVDPFSALITKAKCATRAEPAAVSKLLRRRARRSQRAFTAAAMDLFTEDDLAYAAAVFDRVCPNQELSGDVWSKMLGGEAGALNSEVLAVAAISLAGRALAKVARGSNPVWYRATRTNNGEQVSGLADLAPSIAKSLLADLEGVYATPPDVNVMNMTFLESNLPAQSIDRLLTSPPYLNRLDYVVSHIPEIALLSGLLPLDAESLRKRMLGTTKMLGSHPVNELWGPSCLELLDRIQNHSSWASSTYYYRFFCQYFSELYRSMEEMKRVCRVDARGIVVIQDSYYKEIRVPLTAILKEMGSIVGIRVSEQRTETTTGHIGSMSPRQRAYVPHKTLTESVLLLGF